jgi:hypothetical protein
MPTSHRLIQAGVDSVIFRHAMWTCYQPYFFYLVGSEIRYPLIYF